MGQVNRRFGIGGNRQIFQRRCLLKLNMLATERNRFYIAASQVTRAVGFDSERQMRARFELFANLSFAHIPPNTAGQPGDAGHALKRLGEGGTQSNRDRRFLSPGYSRTQEQYNQSDVKALFHGQPYCSTCGCARLGNRA